MGDYPDWTGLAQVVGTDIMVAVDVQGGYIMLPVDWQSQFAGVFLQPDWTALQGTDKNFRIAAANLPIGSSIDGEYPVPEGKTLFITGLSFFIVGSAPADRNNNQMGFAELYNLTTATYLAELGGNGGNGISFSKPLVIDGGETFMYLIYNRANHLVNAELTVWGYEI